MKLIKTRAINNWTWLYGPEEQNQKFCWGVLEAMTFGKSELGVPEVEFIYAVSDLIKSDHEVAEFGNMKGTFLFSRKGKTE